MIEGMEAFVGLILEESAVEDKQRDRNDGYYIITRPDFYGSSIHINMFIHFGEDRIITDFSGSKCYSVSRGLYNRSAKVHDREFTKRDIQYLRRFVRENTEE